TPTRSAALDEAIAVSIDESRAALPPALAAAIERVLAWLARRPIDRSDAASASDVALPGWVPLSRMLGTYYGVRPIGRGAGRAWRRAHARRPRARRGQGARLLGRCRPGAQRAGVRAFVPRRGRCAARTAQTSQPCALHHVRRECAAQTDPRHGVRARAEPR